MRRASFITVVAALLIASRAGAAPVAVEYFADSKVSKGTSATDVLTFELFQDDPCTSLIGTAHLFAGSGSIQHHIDETQVASGAPKAVRLHAIIDAPTTDAAPYLRLTGGAVMGVPDDC